MMRDNTDAIRWLDAWYATPDDRPPGYWDELRAALAAHPLQLRTPQGEETRMDEPPFDPNQRPFDPLDAAFLIQCIDERGLALTNEGDQAFLDDLADQIHEGIVHHITQEEKAHLYRCAREVGITWVDHWL
jgi:hypothetical protein